MAVTIKDIAKIAGVSYSTVSRALANQPGINVETRRRIFEIAEEAGYTANGIARSLVTRKSHTIGLIIPDITNPFFPEVARGVEEIAGAAGYNVFLCNSDWDKGKEKDLLFALEQQRVDGIIMSSVDEQGEVVKKFQNRRGKIVLINRSLPGDNIPSVVVDNVEGACQVIKYLQSLGHERIAFIGGMRNLEDSKERLQGYRLAMRDAHLTVDEDLVLFGSFKRESGYANARLLLSYPMEKRPTAIFAVNDVLALAAIEAAKGIGLSIPRDLSIIGFDDIPLASYSEIGLTTVTQPKYVMGEIATQMLLRMISGQDNSDAKREVVLVPQLIVRKTTGPVLVTK